MSYIIIIIIIVIIIITLNVTNIMMYKIKLSVIFCGRNI